MQDLPGEGSERLELLAAERRRALERLAGCEADLAAVIASSEDANGDDEHDPEGSTIAYERARLAALRSQAEFDLADIDLALARLEAGSEVICEGCGEPIPTERFAALPAARTCVACAERRGRPATMQRGGERARRASAD